VNKILLFSILFFQVFNLQAQSTTTALKEKGLIKGQTIYLNSKGRLGGKSRVVVPIKLPPNTVSWSYSFSTVKTNDAKTKLAGSGLEMQIAKLIANGAMNVIKAGVVTNIVGQLVKPTGSGVVDVYLTDGTGLKQFEEKDIVGMYANDIPAFYREGTAQNSRNGIFQIPLIRDDLYLCLRNPSVTEGVAVSVDVVAVVSVNEYRDIWSAKSIESLYTDCLATFSIRNSEAEKVCDCAKNKVTTTYKPSQFQSMSPAAKDNLLRSNIPTCTEQEGFADAAHKERKVKEIMELVRGQGITKDYKGSIVSYQELLQLGVDSGEIYNELAYSQLCTGKFEDAKKNLTKALGKEPGNLNLLKNLANYYLLSGDKKQALDIYQKYKGKKLENKQKFREIVSEDLKEFERLGFGNTNFSEVRQKLNID
jgi:DNA-binding Lrp family transcriptional regulator